jgi:hypothetical protein
MVTISLTLTNHTSGIIVITIFTVLSHLVHTVSVVFLTDKKAHFDKRKTDESLQIT